MRLLPLIVLIGLVGLSYGADVQRKSADGVPYPAAAKQLFQATLPLIGSHLGGLPEEMGRVMNSVASKEVLAKRLRNGVDLKSEWFVVGFAGSDVAGFDLEDGRVTRIVLIFAQPSAIRSDETQKRFAALGHVPTSQSPRATIKNKLPQADLPVLADIDPARMEFWADPVEWMLLYHPAKPEVAKAMRSKAPLAGMTTAQAMATFGTPASTGTAIRGGTEIMWEEREPVPTSSGGGAAVTSARDAYFNLQASVLNPKSIKTRVSRRITIVFDKDVAIDVGDDRYNNK